LLIQVIMKVSFLLLILMLCCWFAVHAQAKTNVYTVKYKGGDVGTVQLTQSIYGDSIHYTMTSDVKTRFIFSIRVKSFEESSFKNGRLIYSAVNRTVNGDEKLRKQTKAGNKNYTLSGDGKQVILQNESIGYNLMRMYCLEPVNIAHVYSDAYQQFLTIKRVKAHTYKVQLPDGNYNYYNYTNGVCSKVEVFNPLYNMELVLRQQGTK